MLKCTIQKIFASPAEINFMGIKWLEKLLDSIKPQQTPWVTSRFENKQTFAWIVVCLYFALFSGYIT